ncbi:MAG: M48 family metallopeptidase [Ignavibacteria bacterium]|nr:M48 family metallopeptidase [Ignavibacteria bacterium]
MTLRPPVIVIAIVLITGFGLSCSSVPLTGRSQLNIIPDSEVMAMSYQQYDQFLNENKLSSNAEQTAMIKRTGARIQASVEAFFRERGLAEELNGYDWEFNLIESDQVNAWCMPGGKVVFYTGILPICQDELGVAVVMGHEVAHAVAEHGAERMSHSLIAQLGGTALAVAVRNEPAETQALWMGAFGVGAQYGVMLPFSRSHESEADHIGLIFMAMAGYDPTAAVSFWERMAAQGGQKPPEFMSTHPSDETRIAEIRQHLPEALTHYIPSP